MRLLSANVVFSGIVGACSLFLLGGTGLSRPCGGTDGPPASQPAKIGARAQPQ